MKKIISKGCLLLVVALLLFSCKGKDNKVDETRTTKQILQEVNTVQAIGKVSPAHDWVVLSSPISARIQELLVAEGDSVSEGQLLIVLESMANKNELEIAKARLNSLRTENRVSLEELEKAKVSAKELLDRYQTSRKLFERQAETRERMEQDYSIWQQQELSVRAVEQSIKADKAKEIEQQMEVNAAETLLSDYRITAPSAGVVVDLTAKLGQSVSSSQELGRIMGLEDPIVIAEVDELFADDVKVGQEVLLSAAGRMDTTLQGRVTYVSPILTDKSILYEMANEGKDRRVRKIKIRVDQVGSLPVNAKVDCQIKIR